MGDLCTIDRLAAYNTAFDDRPGFPKLANIASESGRPSGPSNPGIIITWKPRLIHVALGQLGSPVPQGPDVITSLNTIFTGRSSGHLSQRYRTVL